MAILDDVISTGVKKYGEGTFIMGDASGHDFNRVPTGIFAVDYAVGGGIPVGVSSSIYGPPGGGKSLVAIRTLVGAQSICWSCYEYLWDCKCSEQRKQKVVIVLTEGGFDMDWAVNLGLDPDETIIAEPDSGEQASDIIAECLRAKDCGVVLLDSLAMITPTVEIEASAEEQQIGAQAKLISKMMRRAKTILMREKKKKHPVCFVCTNQIRAKIGGFSFGPNETVAGGFVSKHDWHLCLRMSQLKSTDIDKETELPINGKFKMSTVSMGNKKKVFTMSGSAEFNIIISEKGEYPKGTINDYKTVERYADSLGLILRDPWGFQGQVYSKKGDITEQWADVQKFLSVKKYIVDESIIKVKESSTY